MNIEKRLVAMALRASSVALSGITTAFIVLPSLRPKRKCVLPSKYRLKHL
jgi:hypothetical protein